MKTKHKFIAAPRTALIAAMRDGYIDRRIDKMDRYEVRNYILLDYAKAAAKNTTYPAPEATIEVRIYATNKPGTYGHQFMAAIWVHTPEGGYYQASGAMTGGCGYDKVSTAVDSAIRALGLDYNHIADFAGTGLHWAVMREFMAVLAGRRQWFEV